MMDHEEFVLTDDEMAAAVRRPRTQVGRELLDDLAYLRGNYAPMILEIEAEAARLSQRDVVERIRAAMDIGLCRECSNADEIYRALDAELAP
jgi:hypothetical protein